MRLHGHQKLIKPIPFWGIDGHFPGWFPDRSFYLVSAAGLWNRKRSKFVRRSYPAPSKRMFLDSGGFSFFRRWGDYPFSPDEFLTLVEHCYYGYQPLLWASLDYPCESDVSRQHGLINSRGFRLYTNSDRIEATLDYLDYFSRVSSHSGLVPVIQGYSLDERLYCCDQIFKRGLNRSLMAIGSLCALPSIREIASIVRDISFYFPGQRWHLFGVKVSYLTKYLVPASVFSFDTAAWSLGLTNESKNATSAEDERLRFFRYCGKLEGFAATKF